MKKIATLMLSVLCTSPQLWATERPSLASHELRLNNIDLALGTLGQQANNQQQLLDQLSSQLDNIQLTPGPQGEKGDKGDTGARGATGAPGPLSDLNCLAGQFAVFDGSNWQCADAGTQLNVANDDNCISGFNFSLQIENTSLNSDAWLRKCDDGNRQVSFYGPVLATRRASENVIEAPQLTFFPGEFDNNFSAFNTEPFEVPTLTGEAAQLLVQAKLVSVANEINQDLLEWANDIRPERKVLRLQHQQLGFELLLQSCLPNQVFVKPLLLNGLIRVEHHVLLNCSIEENAQDEFRFASHPLLEFFVASAFENRRLARDVSVLFDQPDLAAFNRSYQNFSLHSYQLPNFNRNTDRSWSVPQHAMQLRQTVIFEN